MTGWQITAMILLQLWIVVDLIPSNYPMAIFFAGCALANVGALLAVQ